MTLEELYKEHEHGAEYVINDGEIRKVFFGSRQLCWFIAAVWLRILRSRRKKR